MEKSISYEKTLKKWKIKLSIIILIGIVALIFSVIFSIDIINQYKFTQSIKTTTKSILKNKSNKLYYLDFKGSMISDKNYNNYLYNLSKTEGITYAGAFCTGSIYVKELQNNNDFVTKNKEIRKSNTPDIIKIGMEENNSTDIYKYTDTLIISSGLLDFMAPKIYKGESYNNSKDEIPILIGYSYKDVVDIGQTIISSPNDTKYKVVGILDKNCTWIDENNLSEVGNHNRNSINLDNYFVIVYDNKRFKNNENIIFTDPTTYIYAHNKECLDNIHQLNNEYKQNFVAVSMSNIYSQIDENSIFNIKYEILRNNVAICLMLLSIILWIYLYKHKPTE